jgi:hypothetical protein
MIIALDACKIKSGQKMMQLSMSWMAKMRMLELCGVRC